MKLLTVLLALCCASCAFAVSPMSMNANEVSPQCLKCLCEGSTNNCDRSAGCDNYGFCGPFHMTKHYWEEAGSFGNDFERCAKDYSCAEKTVKAYMEKFGKDCDGDGVTDCKDYALIHHKGRNGCPYSDFASDSLYRYVADCIKRQPQQQPGIAGSMLTPKVGQQYQEQHKQPEQQWGQDQLSQQRNINIGEDDRSQSEGFGQNVKDKFHETKENVKDQFRDTKDSFKEGAKNIKENIQDKFTPDQQEPQQQFRQHEGIHNKDQQQLPYPEMRSQQDKLQQQQQHHQQQPLHKDIHLEQHGEQQQPELLHGRKDFQSELPDKLKQQQQPQQQQEKVLNVMRKRRQAGWF